MKMLLALAVTLVLTGCGAYGEPLWLARIADAQDPCQRPNKPSFCGAASGKTVYQRDWRTGNITSTYRRY